MIRYAMIFITLCGCATSWQSHCRHEALVEAAVVGEFLPTRIATGPGLGGRPHATGQALVDGEWHDLLWTGGYVMLGPAELRSVDATYTLKGYAGRCEITRWREEP